MHVGVVLWYEKGRYVVFLLSSTVSLQFSHPEHASFEVTM